MDLHIREPGVQPLRHLTKRRVLMLVFGLAAVGGVFVLRTWAANGSGQQPAEPFRIAGNFYYVGANDVTSFLITGLVAIGWMVAALHRRRLPGIVIVFAATLLIPATFQALEIRRMLDTELWPGWGWGSFRWALLYQALFSFVAYPVCVLFGGLWTAQPDREAT